MIIRRKKLPLFRFLERHLVGFGSEAGTHRHHHLGESRLSLWSLSMEGGPMMPCILFSCSMSELGLFKEQNSTLLFLVLGPFLGPPFGLIITSLGVSVLLSKKLELESYSSSPKGIRINENRTT